jgi:very-short-patch-repair endonuclease
MKNIKKSNKQFLSEVYDQVNNEYSFLEKYINNNTKILCRHNKCKYEWKVKPNYFLNNKTRCPKCTKRLKKTTLDFIKEVKKISNNEYKVLGKYINIHTKIKMKHKICRSIHYYPPNHFLNGTRCPKCANRLKKTTKEFKLEVMKLVQNRYKVIGKYISNKEHILIRHIKCGHEYAVTPKNFLKGRRCPKCSKLIISKATKLIEIFFKNNNIEYEKEKSFKDCKYRRSLYFDFYLKDLNLLIEYDGVQHFKKGRDSFYKAQIRDSIKNNWCLSNKISLLRLNYKHEMHLTKILKKILIEGSSTTIEKYNIYYINENSTFICDNKKYIE